jgi:hypothetical protein
MTNDGALWLPEIRSMHALLRWFGIITPLVANSAALAQSPGDLIDQTRRMQAVAGQQLEADVRAGLSEAARLADKSETLNRYKGLLARLEADKSLPDDRRAALQRVLQERIGLAETAAATTKEDAPAKGRTQFAEGAGAKSAEPSPADTGKIKETIAAIAVLNAQGNRSEAQRQAHELLQKYPDNLSVQVLNGLSTSASSMAEATAVRTETETRRVAAMREIDKSARAPVADVEFGPDWAKLSAERKRRYGQSAEDKAVIEALAAPIKVEFKNTRLQDAMDYMSNQMKRTIILDKNALDEGQLNYDTPISFSPKTPVATRTALRAMLNGLNLTYVIRDGVIHVTSTTRAKDLMVTRVYDIGPLVIGNAISPPGVAVDPQLAQNVQIIVDMITQSVDPSSWTGKGGIGVIGYNIATHSLIIRQSAEIHTMIGNSLGK